MFTSQHGLTMFDPNIDIAFWNNTPHLEIKMSQHMIQFDVNVAGTVGLLVKFMDLFFIVRQT